MAANIYKRYNTMKYGVFTKDYRVNTDTCDFLICTPGALRVRKANFHVARFFIDRAGTLAEPS